VSCLSYFSYGSCGGYTGQVSSNQSANKPKPNRTEKFRSNCGIFRVPEAGIGGEIRSLVIGKPLAKDKVVRIESCDALTHKKSALLKPNRH
jgi:hypothetical protein